MKSMAARIVEVDVCAALLSLYVDPGPVDISTNVPHLRGLALLAPGGGTVGKVISAVATADGFELVADVTDRAALAALAKGDYAGVSVGYRPVYGREVKPTACVLNATTANDLAKMFRVRRADGFCVRRNVTMDPTEAIKAIHASGPQKLRP